MLRLLQNVLETLILEMAGPALNGPVVNAERVVELAGHVIPQMVLKIRILKTTLMTRVVTNVT